MWSNIIIVSVNFYDRVLHSWQNFTAPGSIVLIKIWIFSWLKYLSGLIRLLLDDRALRVTRSGVRMAQSGPSSLPSSSVFRSLMDDEHQDQLRALNCNWQWGINIQIGEQELGITQRIVVWHQTIIWNRDEREVDCNPGPALSHLRLREAKPINSKKFVLPVARLEQNHAFVWQYWRETQRQTLW